MAVYDAKFVGKAQTATRKYVGDIASPILRPNGPQGVDISNSLRVGKSLRDKNGWQYPILGGAIQVFQQLAASREWTISGPPRQVPRAVEWLQNTQTIDPYTGLVYYGYEQFLQRRAMDHIFLGMKTAICDKHVFKRNVYAPLEYADPTLLIFNRSKSVFRQNGIVNPVTPDEIVWEYAREKWLRADSVNVEYPFPIGTNLFVAPIMYLLPSAILAWLIRESDMASVDGRRLRDIFVVANPSLEDTLREAISAQVQLWSGADPETVGIPLISVNYTGSAPVKDMFARLGLSEIPESFNREEFIFYYVNEISAALGLALRHFWNNEKTTNRALEVVQEQRQQQKGPAVFVRSEQRMLNRSGFLNQFTTGSRGVRFAFIEETDASSMKDRATVMKMFAEALEKVSSVFGAAIDAESYVAWMQSEGVLPNELSLINVNQELQMVNPDSQTNAPDEETGESDPKPTTMPGSHDDDSESANVIEKLMRYDEIMMDSEGKVLARRRKTFSFQRALRDAVKNDMQKSWLNPSIEDPVRLESSSDTRSIDLLIEEAIRDSEMRNEHFVRQFVNDQTAILDVWKVTQTDFSDKNLVNTALGKCLDEETLTDEEREVIDVIALTFI